MWHVWLPWMTTWMASFLKKNKIQWNNTLLFNFHIHLNLINCQVEIEICEIAAVEENDQFSVYIFPKHGITSSASTVNKLSVKHGVLFYDWMMPCQNSWTGSSQKNHVYCMIAHNAKGFDVKHLFKALTSCSKFEMALGFSDTLPAFKELYTGRKSFTKQSSARDLLRRLHHLMVKKFHSNSKRL